MRVWLYQHRPKPWLWWPGPRLRLIICALVCAAASAVNWVMYVVEPNPANGVAGTVSAFTVFFLLVVRRSVRA